MTPSQQAKSMGFKSLTQVRDHLKLNKNGHPLVSLNTLTNWHRDKPELFRIVLLGVKVDLMGEKSLGDKCCLDIYKHYHVSQLGQQPAAVKNAWEIGQKLWLESVRR